ncbi:MAG: DNA translocase FtsK [Chloroflexia bacterium]
MSDTHVLRPWLEQRAERIEQLCEAHRLRVRVLGGVVTPRLVRFHLAVDPTLPLRRLMALEEELALALEVASARIVRREGILSLEVPRPQPAYLSLLRTLADLPPLPPYTALLGRDAEGSPLLLRLPSPDVSHILVAGTTGSGKTALARTVLVSLALANHPDALRLLLIDPKGQGFAPFAGLPHLVGPVLDSGQRAAERLGWLLEEMASREARALREPRVVVAVDEVADLLCEHPEVGEPLTRLAARGRGAGIHLLLCTQKPTAEALGSLLRANLPCRIVGRVVSAQEAALATGLRGTGAERLMGRGDFLLIAGGEVVRFQAAYVSAAEIVTLVEGLQQEIAAEQQGSKAPASGVGRLRALVQGALGRLAGAAGRRVASR